MELQVVNGGSPSVRAEDWTILPIGWPGPEPSFGIVRSVGDRTAVVHDVFLGMDCEFRLDLVEVLTAQRYTSLNAKEIASLDRARRLAKGASEERLAA